MNRIPILCVLAMLTMASDAMAETLTFQNRSLEFEAPPGYCLLDRDDAFQEGIFEFFVGLQRSMGAELLAVYAQCDELEEIVARRLDHFIHYGMLMVVPAADDVARPVAGGTRDGFIAHMATVLGWPSGQSANAIPKINREIADLGITMTELSEPAVIGTDDNALYAAFRSTLENGGAPVSIATIAAYTMVAELPLSNNLTAPAGDDDVLNVLFGIQAALMADFIAANE